MPPLQRRKNLVLSNRRIEDASVSCAMLPTPPRRADSLRVKAKQHVGERKKNQNSSSMRADLISIEEQLKKVEERDFFSLLLAPVQRRNHFVQERIDGNKTQDMKSKLLSLSEESKLFPRLRA